MASHYEATLQRDIDLIRSKVLEMSNLAEKALRDALKAVVERHRQAFGDSLLTFFQNFENWAVSKLLQRDCNDDEEDDL